MGQEIALLDEALNLARKEKSALENGAYEEAIELADKRGQITSMAWDFVDLKNSPTLKERLQELAGLQKQLTEIATSAQNIIRARLSNSKKEKRRIKGYHLAVGQALQ